LIRKNVSITIAKETPIKIDENCGNLKVAMFFVMTRKAREMIAQTRYAKNFFMVTSSG